SKNSFRLASNFSSASSWLSRCTAGAPGRMRDQPLNGPIALRLLQGSDDRDAQGIGDRSARNRHPGNWRGSRAAGEPSDVFLGIRSPGQAPTASRIDGTAGRGGNGNALQCNASPVYRYTFAAVRFLPALYHPPLMFRHPTRFAPAATVVSAPLRVRRGRQFR